MLQVVVHDETAEDSEENYVEVAYDRTDDPGLFKRCVQLFGQKDARQGADQHYQTQAQVHIAQVAVLERVDDRGTHDQGQAGAYGEYRWDTEHQQAPCDEEAAAHAKESAQRPNHDAQKQEESWIDGDFCIGEPHASRCPQGFSSVHRAGWRPTGIPRSRIGADRPLKRP